MLTSPSLQDRIFSSQVNICMQFLRNRKDSTPKPRGTIELHPGQAASLAGSLLPKTREAELPPEALGDWCLLRSSLCHCHDTEGRRFGERRKSEVERIWRRRSRRKPLKQMAEAHGNRTHPRHRNRRRTTVLKTAEGTSPRALPRGDCSRCEGRGDGDTLGSRGGSPPPIPYGDPTCFAIS